jgi:putative addiction module CopG family antidote
MHVNLSHDLEEFVENKIRSGDYPSAQELIEDAVARLRAEEIDPAELRRLVAEGQAEADRGELIDVDVVFERLANRSARHRENPQ